MPAETLHRVFEPFFTTKQPGKGTGLGLSMVYGFVKQSGGHITVSSELGLGTAFTLYFPRAAEAADCLSAARGTGGAMHKRGTYHGVILAVDDNPQVQATTVLQLQQLGYRVIKADNAAVALEILDSSEPIDLLFTDIVMPGELNGKQLAAEALNRRPDLAVLFTSGYPGVMDNKDGVAEMDFALLAKPYRRTDLERAVSDALRHRELRVA
jgi:CheY-like chemotaxis protein